MGLFGRNSKRSSMASMGGMRMSHSNPGPPFSGVANPAVTPYPLRHVPTPIKQQCTVVLKTCMKDLSNLKQAGTVNPTYMMTERWLQVLSTCVLRRMCIVFSLSSALAYISRILEPMCVLAPPGKGMQDWLIEVQISKLFV